MATFTAVIERCNETGLYVGFVPGFPGAHSQGETLDELNHNLKEVIEMLLEDGPPEMEGEFIGTQNFFLVPTVTVGMQYSTLRVLLPLCTNINESFISYKIPVA